MEIPQHKIFAFPQLNSRSFVRPISSTSKHHCQPGFPSFLIPSTCSCAVVHFVPSLISSCFLTKPLTTNTNLRTPISPNIITNMQFTLTLLAASAALVNAGVFTQQTYDDISISGGTAGNAQQEALAVFDALDLNDLASVDQDDLEFLDSVNGICNDAEEEAFNPAIDAASGEEADALQRGKIKNKVLKLTATILKLMAQQAQGEDVAADMAEEQTKLDNNIQQDEDEAGNASTALQFDATTD
ncbi:hypothetical protein F5Y15DRAFT_370630 [Xylariaceae sp. FL0016]|nr:hypothetical protein F5Y15DRAFT_370630 [Xylariaceae sp. FL0016]